jgi:predicted glycoside hydrolase/deacetylase ChbG (UPF0249 family)
LFYGIVILTAVVFFARNILSKKTLTCIVRKSVIHLIVNADDFGLTSGVNQSILHLSKAGALSSATLMGVADYTAAAAEIAMLHPDLGVGCHVVLVDGTPAHPIKDLRGLVLPSGTFRPTLGSFVADVTRGSIPETEIEVEAIAQIQRLQGLGIRVTHLDTHKHTHMYPGVLRPLLRAAIVCGIRAIRNPFEPDWALRATRHAPLLRRIQVRLLRARRKTFLRLVKQAGLATTDGSIGVLATGTLDAQTLRSLLKAMPAGTWELVCHPGHFDEELNAVRTRLKQSRQVEHDALREVVPQFLLDHLDVSLINFMQMQQCKL